MISNEFIVRLRESAGLQKYCVFEYRSPIATRHLAARNLD